MDLWFHPFTYLRESLSFSGFFLQLSCIFGSFFYCKSLVLFENVFVFLEGNQDGKFSVGFRDGVVRTVVGLDRESQAAYTLVVEAIGGSETEMFYYKKELSFRRFVNVLHQLYINNVKTM